MGETNPSWKWLSRRKMAPGGAKRGTCLKLSCLLKPSTWVSAAETVLWLEKGNSWGAATRIISAISADYINCSPRKKWVLRSPLEHQLLSPHPCTHLPASLPGNNHHRWLCNTCLTMRVSLGRMYPVCSALLLFLTSITWCWTNSASPCEAAVPQVCSVPLVTDVASACLTAFAPQLACA